jgi:hypothetical protein
MVDSPTLTSFIEQDVCTDSADCPWVHEESSLEVLQRGGQQPIVVVEEEYEHPTCLFEAAVTSVGSFGMLFESDNSHAVGVPPAEPFARAVGRYVIHYDRLA